VVTFDLPQPRNVSARVVDVTGRVTRTLVEGVLPAGRHRTTWDGTNDNGRRVTSGVYFVVLEAEADRARQKIIVLR
jgi:flagellar hook assembly protein FlgD